jgi:hypothetical protein
MCTLFTFIPPNMSRPVQGRERGPAWQAACVQSWKVAGFRVVSLNSPEEIERFQAESTGIEFQELPLGRSRPLITDFFDAATAYGGPVAGVISADCMMIQQFDFMNRLKPPIGGIAIAERIDISPDTLMQIGKNGCHFDAFFFDVGALTKIKYDHHWRIGEVWYDFWLPMAFGIAGLDVKTLPAPILLHLNHEQICDWPGWATHFLKLVDLVRINDGAGLDPNLARELQRTRSFNMPDIHRLSHRLFECFSSREPLWHPEPDSADELVVDLLQGMASPPLPPPPLALHPFHAKLQRAIDRVGLRHTLYALGLVERHTIN